MLWFFQAFRLFSPPQPSDGVRGLSWLGAGASKEPSPRSLGSYTEDRTGRRPGRLCQPLSNLNISAGRLHPIKYEHTDPPSLHHGMTFGNQK